MAKLKARIAESSEDVEIVGKKAQKRMAKAAARAAAKAARATRAAQAAPKAQTSPAIREPGSQPEDAMSRCALLCQDQRWREAAVLCRKMEHKAQEDGKPELAMSLEGARKKIEYSLRRQMASAVIVIARDFLNKEYLLDV